MLQNPGFHQTGDRTVAHSIKQRLQQGKVVRVFSVGPLASAKLIELISIYDHYHAIWIDQEHSALPHAQVELLTLACRAAGLDSYVRIPPTDYATVMRPMEAGAGGIKVAQVRSVAEVERVVAWAKYPPVGIRGMFLSNYEARWGTDTAAHLAESANRDRWVAIQIETSEALAAVEQIAAVEGVDHLFVGPGDLSVALGVPGDFLHPKCVSALKTVSAAAQKAGKSWGVLSKEADHAAVCRDLGCRLFAFTGDMAVVHAGVKATREKFRAFFDEK
jgi:2-dehydro-3-deoxyglucarate aldolase/4-hydroxy-2-oxoheptanedioate aldolase